MHNKKNILLLLIILISLLAYSVEKIGFVYDGPTEYFYDVFSKVYKYADIITPPTGKEETFEVRYKNNNYEIIYKNKKIITDLNEMEKNIKKMLNTASRSVFVISDNSNIITDNSTRTSAFFNWDPQLKIKLQKDGITYDYYFNPPMGERIIHIPEKYIEVNINGEQESVFLNNQNINLPAKLNIPQTKFTLFDGIEKYDYDLTNYASDTYIIDLQKQNIFKKIQTKISNAYEIKSGVFLRGNPLSIWFPKEGDPVITDSKFYSNYGDINKINERYSFKGTIAFIYEYNKTVYIISSAGELISMGAKEIFKDFGRSPMNVSIKDNSLEINTFKMEKYIVNFDGGVYKDGNVYSIFNNMPVYKYEKNYESKKYLLEVKDNIVNIYIK